VKTWRLVSNLVVFAVVALALIGYGVVDLLGDPFQSTTDVSAVFPTASGVGTNFSVELNGVTVGTVSSVRLVHKGAEVAMAIDHGVSVPSDVVASIGIANDLGEQVVELTPRHGGHVPPLRSGALVPVAKSGVPVQVGQVVAEATRLLRDVPAGKLNELLRELAQALQGQSGNLRTIVAASTQFSQQFLRYQRQFTQLLADSPPVMNAVSAAGPQLEHALANTEAMVQVLAQEKTYLKGALTQLGALTTNQAPDLGCLIHDFSQLDANLDQPANLSNLSSSLSLNQYFFHAVTSVAVAGTAKPLVSGEQANPNQTILRTRLLLPPGSPMGDTYATPVPVPAVKPGAACNTELGQGVGAASQPGFSPAAGGVLDAPSASEGQVRGRGDGNGPTRSSTSSTTQVASYRGHAASATPVLLVIGGVLLPALLLAWGVRPSRRRTRRRA
jgi:phospholipid/cholesterol/gamma-HCH transport system substrate-binding protein